MLQKLQHDNQGRLKKLRSNYRIALQTNKEWRDKLRYNALTDRYELHNPDGTIEQWCDYYDTILLEWFEYAHDIKPSKPDVIDARIYVAHMQEYDPLLEWCLNLQWDGKPRLDTWLRRYIGGIASDDYIRVVGRSIFLGAATRALNPGCEFDLMLVITGPQGCGKSRSVKALTPWPELFSDSVPDISTAGTDAETALQGKAIIEMPELDAIRRADVTTLKAYISRPVADIRKKYARSEGRYPRRCIFIGTGNRAQFLKDPTGARRFVPLTVTRCDVDGLAKVKDQLWAEAVYIVRERGIHSASWLLDPSIDKELNEMRSEASEIDPWLEVLQEWIFTRPEIKTRGEVALSVREIFSECPFFARLNAAQINRAAEMRLSDILRQIGGKKLPMRRYDGVRLRKWQFLAQPKEGDGCDFDAK